MEELSYNWIDEDFPVRGACINVNRPCQLSNCPAWYSRGDGGKVLTGTGIYTPRR